MFSDGGMAASTVVEDYAHRLGLKTLLVKCSPGSKAAA
jgi:hypothetical protein